MSEQKVKHSIIEYVLTLLSAAQQADSANTQAERDTYLETAYEIQNFLDEIPGGFLIYHAFGNEEIIYANTALIRIFGCDSFKEFKQITGGTFKGIVHPDDIDAVEKSIGEQIFDSQYDLDYVEYRIIRKDGRVRWIEDYGHFVRNGYIGNVFYVFMTDVTDKKERELAEKALLIAQNDERERTIKTLVEEYDRERKLVTQEQLRRLDVIEGLSVNYDTILYVDLDASTVIPYRQGNRVYRQFEGEPDARELNWYVKDYVDNIVCPEDRDEIRKITNPDYMRKKLAEVKTYFANYRGSVPGGEMQHLQIRIVNVGSKDRVSQAVIGYRNIDDEVHHEKQHLQALENALARAEQAEVARNTFLSNMSHDLRTPLNAIFGYTTLAKNNADKPEVIADYLDKINNSGKQIFDLIDKLLELTYIESNEIKIKETECDIEDVVMGACEDRRAEAERKNVELIFDTANLKHSAVYADPERIKQMLIYIIGNAVKYNKTGGKVRVTLSEADRLDGDYAKFKFIIADTGIGIEKETLKHIYDPFMREHNTTTSGVYGTGLGLTIAKMIVDMMGGSIDIKSAVGKGSTFTVTVGLKVCNAAAANAINIEKTIKRLKGKRVLVVEDNEINLEIITDILESHGLVIDTAENGSIAVNKVAAAAPDYYTFVLMDIQMPVMDGREATKSIRALPNKTLAQLPVIALSANAFESDKRMSMEAGMNAHLTKPLDITKLFETVAEVFIGKTKKSK